MQNDRTNPNPQAQRSYPWARALLVLVLYISLILFLWHFPVQSIRHVFRNLLTGLGYILLGFVFVSLTFVALLLIPSPAAARRSAETKTEIDDPEPVSGFVLPGRVLVVPELRDADCSSAILDLLHNMLDDLNMKYTFVADTQRGMLTIIGESPEDAAALLDKVATRLQAADVQVRHLD